MPDVSLSTIEIQIEAAANGAVTKINNLADAIHALGQGSDVSKLSGLADIIKSIGDAASAGAPGLQAFSSALREIKTTQGTARRVQDLANAIQQVSQQANGNTGFASFVSQMRELDHMRPAGMMTELMQQLRAMSGALDDTVQALNRYQIAFQDVRNATQAGLPGNKFTDTARSTHQASNALIKMGEAARTALGWMWKLSKTTVKLTIGKAFQMAANSISGMTKKVTEAFAAIKRIAVYRLLRTALKEIAKAFKEGLENAYFFSKNVGGDLAAALDQLAVKSNTMKNQLGAAFGGLLQNIMPIIQKIIAAITSLAASITALFSMFGGRGTYLKAVDASGEFAKNTASGASSAKKMKDYLMGIDELNVIKKPDDDGGGGGGGNAVDYASMFEETELPDWMKNIQDLLNMDMFKSAGAALADHLNDIVKNWNAEEWGEKLGTKIQHGVEFAWGFLFGKTTSGGEGFSFEEVGKKLQTAINGIMDEINPEQLGAVLTWKIKAIVGIAKGALEGYSADETGKWLSKLVSGAINAVPWEDLGSTITGWIQSLINTAASFLENHNGGEISEAIKKFVNGINISETIESVKRFLRAAASELGEIFSSLLGPTEDIRARIQNGFDNIGIAISHVITGIENVVTKFTDAFFGKEGDEKSSYEIVMDHLSKAFETISNDIKRVSEDFKRWTEESSALDNLIENVNKLAEAWSSVVKNLATLASSFEFDIGSVLDAAAGRLSDFVIILTGVANYINYAIAVVHEFASELEATKRLLNGEISLKEWWSETSGISSEVKEAEATLEAYGETLGGALKRGLSFSASPSGVIESLVVNLLSGAKDAKSDMETVGKNLAEPVMTGFERTSVETLSSAYKWVDSMDSVTRAWYNVIKKNMADTSAESQAEAVRMAQEMYDSFGSELSRKNWALLMQSMGIEITGEIEKTAGAAKTEIESIATTAKSATGDAGTEVNSMLQGIADQYGLTIEQVQTAIEAAQKGYEEAQSTSEELATVTESTAEGIKKAIELAVLQAGGDFTAGIVEMEKQLQQVVVDITGGTETMVQTMSTTLVTFYDGFMKKLTELKTSVTDDLREMGEAVTSSINDTISPLLKTFFDNLTLSFLTLETSFVNMINAMHDALKSTLDTRISPMMTALYNNLLDGADGVYSHFTEVFLTFMEDLAGYTGDAETLVTDMIQNVWDYVDLAFPSIEVTVIDTLQNVWDFYDLMAGTVMEDIGWNIEKTEEGIMKLANMFKAQMYDCAGIARQEIGAIRSELDNLNGYTVHTYVITHYLAQSGGGTGPVGQKSADKKGAHGFIIRAANGAGMLNTGQFFIAREAGPELVAGIGHHQTAVMNNNQIVESVSEGVFQAVLSAFEIGSQNRGGDTQTIILNVDSREIARAVRQGDKASGYQMASNPTFG